MEVSKAKNVSETNTPFLYIFSLGWDDFVRSPMVEVGRMSDFLCVGDLVSLFCEETEGYCYNNQSR